MGDVIHTSRIKIVKDKGPVRRAFFENFEEPVYYGIHGGIADFYGLKPEVEYPATLDHLISSVAGWLTGTFAGALSARGIQLAPGELTSTVEGDIEKTEHTIKVSEIRVTYHLPIASENLETANRVLQTHPKGCPAHESVKDGIRIKIEADFQSVWGWLWRMQIHGIDKWLWFFVDTAGDIDMVESTQNYKQKGIWVRGLFMLLFLFIHGFAKAIVFFIAVVQFLITLFSDGPNVQLKIFGQGLSTYLYDTTQFLMYNTELKPFPFSDWRNEPPGSQNSPPESGHE